MSFFSFFDGCLIASRFRCVCLDIYFIQGHFYNPQVSTLAFCRSASQPVGATNYLTKQTVTVHSSGSLFKDATLTQDFPLHLQILCSIEWTYSQHRDTGKDGQKVSILLVVSWELNEVQQPAVKASFSLMQEFIPFHSHL